jgi:hypothetical protein
MRSHAEPRADGGEGAGPDLPRSLSCPSAVNHTTLEIGTLFWILDGTGRSACIDPNTRQGDVELLWSLVGETGMSVSWTDEIKIKFTGGAQLRIPAAIDGAPRGTLRGRDGDKDLVEDF